MKAEATPCCVLALKAYANEHLNPAKILAKIYNDAFDADQQKKAERTAKALEQLNHEGTKS